MLRRIKNILLICFLCAAIINISDISSGNETMKYFSNIIIVSSDGSGDFVKLSDAVNYSKNGDIIRIYDGIYGYVGNCNKDLSFLGNGTENTIIKTTNLCPFNFYCNYVIFENISFITPSLGIIAYRANNMVIKNCLFNSGGGISIENGAKFIAENCRFYPYVWPALNLGAYNMQIILKNNFIKSTENGKGIITNSYNLCMRYNELINCTIINSFFWWLFHKADIDITNTIDRHPIYIYNETNDIDIPDNSSLVILNNCTGINIRDHSFDFEFKIFYITSCSEMKIINSNFINNKKYLLRGKDIEKCIIDDINISNKSYGIEFERTNNLTLTNSTFYNNMISFNSYGNQYRIVKNIFMDCGVGFISEGTWKETDFEINNNTFTNVGTAIYINDCQNISILNNIMTGCDTGISISAENIYIKNNIILGAFTGLFFNTYFNEQQGIIENNQIEDCYQAINGSGQVIIRKCLINNSIDYGIKMQGSFIEIRDCIINGTRTYSGIRIQGSLGSSRYIINNTIEKNKIGIELIDTKDNIFYHNQILENEIQVSTNSMDTWNKPYPSGGNYWSNYNGNDIKKGPQQTLDGSDGIGDVPFVISSTQRDLYPLFKDVTSPTAYAGSDVIIDQGDIYLFNSSGSKDDQLIHRVEWEFGYGEDYKLFTEKEFKFRFDIAGNYQVNLTVYDFPGNSDTDDLNITVIDMSDPIPGTQGDIIIEQGEFATFNATSSWDNSAIVNYTWRFVYDGSSVQVFGNITGFRFITPGYYLVTLIVRDTVNRMAEITFNVTVIDTEKPIANAGEDIEIYNGDTVYFDPSHSIDNGLIINITWSFFYKNEYRTIFGEHASFFFLKPGYYSIVLNVTDQFGNYDIDQLLLTVVDTISPNAVINGSTIQEIGGTIELDALSSTDNGLIVKYLWQYTDTELTSMEGPILNHTFDRKGKQKVTLMVFDQWNLSDTVQVTIQIADEQNPIAVAGNDVIIPVGTTFTFDGSGSTDDGTIIDYIWIFEYYGTEKKLEGEVVQFNFDFAGIYYITLKVTDQSDNYGTDTLELSVVDTGIFKGTLVDKDGNPIKGAKITVKASDGRTYSGTSGKDGSFSITLPMGDATYTISCTRYESVSGSIQVNPAQTIELDSSKSVLKKEAGNNWLILISIVAVIILVLIILGIVIFVLTKKKKTEEREVTPVSNELTIEEKLGITIVQSPIPKATAPIKENGTMPQSQEIPTIGNEIPKNDLDDLISEIVNH